ncbi:putative Pentatricopeptide repeat-containing protein, mitochondrial [Cocos nucifera]|uniref:Putative Pentatricopeptide repeat-containing protein, mitochondrial n=1 Tax=Cocos nucifera TaxID=13894 RepID=A0A8K0IM43_COCNU|nr:putative Pentatricopeptide repeat-containing protein, mitochondrial [Cocos nucifera]
MPAAAAAAVVDHLVARSRLPDAVCAVDRAATLGVLLDHGRLLRSLVASGQLLKAKALFSHATKDYIDSAWEFYNQMVERGLKPNVVTYNMMISWYCRNNRVDCALHAMRRHGLAPNLQCYTVVITTLCKENRLVEAEHLFDKMLKRGLLPDHKMFISLINNLPECHEPAIVVKILQALAKADCNFDFSKLSRPFGSSSNDTLQQDAELLFDEIMRTEVLPVDIVFNIMISALCTEGKFSVACHLMDKMSREVAPNLASYSIIINAHCKHGDIDLAFGALNQMVEQGFKPTVAIYDSIRGCLCSAKMLKEATLTFNRMLEAGVTPDEVVYTMPFNCYSKMGKAVDACHLFDEMVTYAILINGHIRLGEIDHAIQLFNQMNEDGYTPDKFSYNTLIKGFCLAGRVIEALSLSQMMQKKGLFPSKVAFDKLVESVILDHSSDLAVKLFEEMLSHGYVPWCRNYNRLLWILSENHKLWEAYRIFNMMLQKGKTPNQETKRHLLEVCYRQGQIDMALEIEESMPFTMMVHFNMPHSRLASKVAGMMHEGFDWLLGCIFLQALF